VVDIYSVGTEFILDWGGTSLSIHELVCLAIEIAIGGDNIIHMDILDVVKVIHSLRWNWGGASWLVIMCTTVDEAATWWYIH